MESFKAPPRKSLFEIEKELFPESIHVVHTYTNKRKSTPRKPNRLSPQPQPEYPSLTAMDLKKRSTLIVENWMQSYGKDMTSTRERTPFADLDPNRLSHTETGKKETISKMRLRSSMTDIESIENSTLPLLSSTPNSATTTKRKSNKLKLKRGKNENNKSGISRKAKRYDNKNTFIEKMDIEEAEEEVVNIPSSHASREDSAIVIEDSQETYVDKDQLAYLEVLRAEEQLQRVRLEEEDYQFEPVDAAVKISLKNNIDLLREELSLLEAQRAPVFRTLNTIIWSSRALVNNIKFKERMLDVFAIKIIDQKLITPKMKNAKTIGKKKRIVKKKVRITGKVKKYICGNKIIYILNGKRYSNPRRDVSVQTYESYQANAKYDLTSEKTSARSSPVEKSVKDQNYKIIEILGSDDENTNRVSTFTQSLHSETCKLSESTEFQVQHGNYNGTATTSYVKLSDSEDEAHETSGSHTVKAQVHVSVESLHEDSDDDVIENTPEAVFGRRLRDTNRSPSYWEERHRTPLRDIPVSPTYTSPAVSSGSSNKENRDPNSTPLDKTKDADYKKDDKSKEGERKSSARRPLSLLFEALPAKVRVACSCLSPVQESLVMLLCKRLGWTYSAEYSPELTHLVVGVDDENKAQRTVKYVCALAAGCWVVSYRWAELSLRQECHLEEESFEVLDWSGERGPLLSRTAPVKLFSALTFCCMPSVTTIRRDILGWILEAAGASMVTPDELEVAGRGPGAGPVIVLHEPKDEALESYEEVVSLWSVRTVVLNYEWALECLGRYKLLCPDIFLLSPRQETTSVAWLNNLCSDTPLSPYSE